jgi:hypothetical protein
MDLEKLQQRLLTAARAHPPGEQVPYAFEQRVMARLRSRPAKDPLTLWSGALWRGAVVCLILTLLFGAWSLYSSSRQNAAPDFSADLEYTVLAAASDLDESL